MRPYSPAVTQEESQHYPHNSKGGLTPLRQPEQFCEIPVTTPRYPSQLERNHEFPASIQDEALLPCCDSRESQGSPRIKKEAWLPQCTSIGSLRFPSQLEWNPKIPIETLEEPQVSTLTRVEAQFPCSDLKAIPSSPWQLERSPGSLDATQKVPWGPYHNWRGILSFPLQLEKNHQIPLSMWDESWLPCSVLCRMLSSLSHLDMSAKKLVQLQRIHKRSLPNPNWRRALYHNLRGSLIPQLSRRLALPQIASSFLHIAIRKRAPFHYNHRGVTHLSIWEEHSTISRGAH